ncbi:C40 family peptidase [Paenibacillus cellulositrophicus]|uniref:C40 family peptidase n=1 Tax=Paenibacillus cellulositrophicus TaxID=562959 RepID=UPI00203E65CA|nr:NlpC/P60 family protein [Paenibacillus cellulositrophicus]
MKKVMLSLIGAAIVFSASATSSFASSVKLESEVDKVVGTPYQWGGTTVAGFDCSGFILYIFDKFNLDLPRTSKTQAQAGTPVDRENLRAGDLVFFNTDGTGISHAGIYIGNNEFAHSSSSKGVTISKLSDSYYKNRYVTARRVVSQQSYLKMISEI